ncbi:MAG TPA: hypothetical protein VHA10_18185 [Hypericibacter adhaerens]|uniref:COG4223 family protein n=1 Tax=Hypericibacter adhaerens TaxID=2602016 RepID=UPI002B8EF09E|nr:hypothetical protein [Hypericibacter adhaerens]HWA45155.1 hypothetical protein [Hypericibacter adhaerens]
MIDLTARSAARAEGEARAGADEAAAAAKRAETPRRPGRVAGDADWRLLAGVALAGAVLGTLLTYVAATLLPLPARLPPMPPDLTAFVNTQGEQITALTEQVGALQQSSKKTQISLDATIAQLDSDMAGLGKRIDELGASMPAPAAPVDLTPLETEVKTLKAQLDAMAAGASGSDAGAIAQSLSSLETSVASLTTRLNGVDQTVSALRTDLDAARKALGDHINAALPNEAGPAMKLPLILSGLESALTSGKPFQDELAALRRVLPDLDVPAELQAAAPGGLSRPDALMARFEATLPAVLAARTPVSGDWTQNAVEWAKSLLALRPASEEPGDSPEAIVSRLEAAMGRRDYAAAHDLLGELPEPMRQAAAPVAGDIAAHAEADRLVADIRSRALSAAESAP